MVSTDSEFYICKGLDRQMVENICVYRAHCCREGATRLLKSFEHMRKNICFGPFSVREHVIPFSKVVDELLYVIEEFESKYIKNPYREKTVKDGCAGKELLFGGDIRKLELFKFQFRFTHDSGRLPSRNQQRGHDICQSPLNMSPARKTTSCSSGKDSGCETVSAISPNFEDEIATPNRNQTDDSALGSEAASTDAASLFVPQSGHEADVACDAAFEASETADTKQPESVFVSAQAYVAENPTTDALRQLHVARLLNVTSQHIHIYYRISGLEKLINELQGPRDESTNHTSAYRPQVSPREREEARIQEARAINALKEALPRAGTALRQLILDLANAIGMDPENDPNSVFSTATQDNIPTKEMSGAIPAPRHDLMESLEVLGAVDNVVISSDEHRRATLKQTHRIRRKYRVCSAFDSVHLIPDWIALPTFNAINQEATAVHQRLPRQDPKASVPPKDDVHKILTSVSASSRARMRRIEDRHEEYLTFVGGDRERAVAKSFKEKLRGLFGTKRTPLEKRLDKMLQEQAREKMLRPIGAADHGPNKDERGKIEGPVEAKVKSPVEAKVKDPVEAKVKSPVEVKVKDPVEAKVKNIQKGKPLESSGATPTKNPSRRARMKGWLKKYVFGKEGGTIRLAEVKAAGPTVRSERTDMLPGSTEFASSRLTQRK
jgi:hypothetical protein